MLQKSMHSISYLVPIDTPIGLARMLLCEMSTNNLLFRFQLTSVVSLTVRYMLLYIIVGT